MVANLGVNLCSKRCKWGQQISKSPLFKVFLSKDRNSFPFETFVEKKFKLICHTNIYEAIKLIFENKTSVLYSGKGNVRNHKELLRNPNDRLGVYYLKRADFCVPVFNWIALITKSQKDERRYFKDLSLIIASLRI